MAFSSSSIQYRGSIDPAIQAHADRQIRRNLFGAPDNSAALARHDRTLQADCVRQLNNLSDSGLRMETVARIITTLDNRLNDISNSEIKADIRGQISAVLRDQPVERWISALNQPKYELAPEPSIFDHVQFLLRRWSA